MDAADGAAVYARLAAQLDLAAAGAVLAGRSGSADATGAVGVARADPQVVARLSTVDDVQSGAGRVAAVLALHEQLDGRAGSYGTGAGAASRRCPGRARRRPAPDERADARQRRSARRAGDPAGGGTGTAEAVR